MLKKRLSLNSLSGGIVILNIDFVKRQMSAWAMAYGDRRPTRRREDR
jgi:hypothetical protein